MAGPPRSGREPEGFGRPAGGETGQIAVDAGGGVTAVPDPPDDERRATDDVAAGEDAGQAGHHGGPVDRDRAPTADLQRLLAEYRGHVLGIEAQGLDGQIRLQAERGAG